MTSRAQCEHIGIAMDNDVNADVVEARFILGILFFLIELSGNKKRMAREGERGVCKQDQRNRNVLCSGSRPVRFLIDRPSFLLWLVYRLGFEFTCISFRLSFSG